MAEDNIPGEERMRQLVADVRNPAVVVSPVLIDVSYIRDPGIQAIVALAASLEWNIVHKSGSPVTLIARDGFKHTVPTNTSVKFSVFRNRVNATVTHSITAIPSPELMDRLVKQYKLDSSHARVFKMVVDGIVEPVEPDEDSLSDELLLPEPSEPQPEFVPTERVEPTLSITTKGQQYVSQAMETVIRKLVADGDEQITYRCLVCGLEFSTKRGVGGHYGFHVQAGEAEATDDARKTVVNVIPDYVPSETRTLRPKDPEPEPPVERMFTNNEPLVNELLELRRIVNEVGRLVGRDEIAQLQERCQELTIERDEAITRANRLASDLRSLRELIGGLSDE
jgi:hypothetical protein